MMLAIVILLCIIVIGCMFAFTKQKERLAELERRIDAQRKDLQHIQQSIRRIMARM